MLYFNLKYGNMKILKNQREQYLHTTTKQLIINQFIQLLVNKLFKEIYIQNLTPQKNTKYKNTCQLRTLIKRSMRVLRWQQHQEKILNTDNNNRIEDKLHTVLMHKFVGSLLNSNRLCKILTKWSAIILPIQKIITQTQNKLKRENNKQIKLIQINPHQSGNMIAFSKKRRMNRSVHWLASKLLLNQFKEKYETQNMSSKQLADLKAKQQQQQEQAVDDLINTVRNIKTGNQGINKELKEQDVLLNTLDQGIDDNTQRMGKTKRKMMKLLDKSSNCCLIVTVVIEIVAIICILVLWQ